MSESENSAYISCQSIFLANGMAATLGSCLKTANILLISHQNIRENEMELEVIPSRFKRLKCLGK